MCCQGLASSVITFLSSSKGLRSSSMRARNRTKRSSEPSFLTTSLCSAFRISSTSSGSGEPSESRVTGAVLSLPR